MRLFRPLAKLDLGTCGIDAGLIRARSRLLAQSSRQYELANVEIIQKVSRLRRHPWHGYAAATAIFIVAVLLREAFGQQDDPNVPFITIFPAIVLAALVAGTGAAIVIAIVGGLLGLYLFTPPFYVFAPSWPWGYVVMLLYAATSAVLIGIVHVLNRAIDDLERERDNSAALFRELQHRVANNMQFAAALLALQRRRAGDGPAADVLENTRARFEAMARLHRRLYDPAALEKPLGEYLETLCRETVEASGAKNIVCVAQIGDDIRLDLQKMLALSLVVTEIITNSLKHAFDETGGTISINLQRAERQLALTIADNGRGMPAVAVAQGKGLGMQILESLSQQLGGTMKVASEKGVTVSLLFPG
jgi:two-component sensor histidine kinase